MKNKVQLKKLIVCSLSMIIIINISFAIISYYQYKEYTKNFNDKIGKIITKVKEEYPNIDENKLMMILNDNTEVDKDIFRPYGIAFDHDALVLNNNKNFKSFLVFNLLVLSSLTFGMLCLFLIYNHIKDKKLAEITKYIEDINNRKYRLDIDDNTEDELSILKNEIYKTTVMLKEMAENSQKDKVQLKDSLSDISHQLKTPLTSIMIMLDNILEDPEMERETKNEFLKDIKREIINLNFLVSSLLKLSKLDANSVNFINKEENIGSIVQEASKNVAMLCDLKNIQIQIDGNQSCSICCDFKWQVEAITNILKNAIEHSNIGSKIEIHYEKNNMYAKIQIRDFGVGIEAEDLPHIFERFYKGKHSSSDSIGIGLALSKSIIEKNNGYISVESEVNQGTIFTIKYL